MTPLTLSEIAQLKLECLKIAAQYSPTDSKRLVDLAEQLYEFTKKS